MASHYWTPFWLATVLCARKIQGHVVRLSFKMIGKFIVEIYSSTDCISLENKTRKQISYILKYYKIFN